MSKRLELPAVAERKPIGFVTVLRFADGTYDLDARSAGWWATPELAAADTADPEQAERLNDGERLVTCAVIPWEGDGD